MARVARRTGGARLPAADTTELPDVDVQVHQTREPDAGPAADAAELSALPESRPRRHGSATKKPCAPRPPSRSRSSASRRRRPRKSRRSGGRKLFGKRAKENSAGRPRKRRRRRTASRARGDQAARRPRPSRARRRRSPISSRKRRGPALTPEHEGGPRHIGRPLGELLTERGLVSEDQLREALTTQTGSGKRLGNILVELGLLSERALDRRARRAARNSRSSSSAACELDREIVDAAARRRRAPAAARCRSRLDGDRVEVAVADPLVEFLQDELIAALGAAGQAARSRPAPRSKPSSTRCTRPRPTSATRCACSRRGSSRARPTKETETTVTTVVDENAPVVKVVNLILDQAVRDRASDVHIEPMADVVRIRVRTDGALHEVMTLPGSMGASLDLAASRSWPT